MLTVPPLSLYVHIPWCVRKCPYCDFNSHERRGPNKSRGGDTDERDYVAALCADMDADLQLFEQRRLHSIFFGGGTPSLFSPRSIGAVIDHAAKLFTWDASTEITLEANPGSADAENFRGYRTAGVNRLSLGAQSFNDRHLTALGRVHDGREARQAIETAIAADFSNINVDLMHGLPDQSAADAAADLSIALEYEPAHLSWYELTIEPNTVFHRRPPPRPDEAVLQRQQEEGGALLAAAGYQRYEVSAYCRPGRESRHNLNYWRFGDYMGIGAGAHGKATSAREGRLLRTRKRKQPEGYLASQGAERREVEAGQRSGEFMLNALRLREGFTVPLFESRTGLPFSAAAERVEYLQSLALLERRQQRIAATERGYRHLNRLLEEFLD